MVGQWLWKDSMTDKTSSTKVIQMIIVLGVVACCVWWAFDGQLTFEEAKWWVLSVFGVERGGNAMTRGVKAYDRRTTNGNGPLNDGGSE